ncbi:MAG: class I SAM-dependent methyltransferase [Halioglobus sp.]|nr:class I SAM-dependent methyltransferase [Halioglobus sp.]
MPEILTDKKLSEIVKLTISHYDDNALSFWEGTRGHDVSQNYGSFLAAFEANQKLDILDFGCGPGRDLAYFKSLGHRAVGLDGSLKFCRMARQGTGCSVLHQSFLSLDLKLQGFDGIFANASLFHIPRQELPRILRQLHSALRPGGILFSSNPRGNSEQFSGERYGHFMEFEVFRGYLKNAGFKVIEHYYRPKGNTCAAQPWLAILSEKLG